MYGHKQISCWVQLCVFVGAALVYQHMYADQLLILAVHSLGCSSVNEHMYVFQVWNCVCMCVCVCVCVRAHALCAHTCVYVCVCVCHCVAVYFQGQAPANWCSTAVCF